MLQSWLILLAAILFEVGATTFLKLSDGFSKIIPTIAAFVLYGLSFWGLAVVLKKIDVGVAYAVWAGLGTAVVAVIGFYCFGEKMTSLKLFSLLLVIAGVIGLNFSSAGH
ncbi:DMT family transporter [Maridesulfovibrio frigidus]|uniref:DMT family transporter n=1 Tax=Maridesulfovibrio frigidus TaxID=340956 RepID=UPI0004E10D2C|nr:multidrug efflux SMR transporter [Maridesulfovibrio frigidus]